MKAKLNLFLLIVISAAFINVQCGEDDPVADLEPTGTNCPAEGDCTVASDISTEANSSGDLQTSITIPSEMFDEVLGTDATTRAIRFARLTPEERGDDDYIRIIVASTNTNNPLYAENLENLSETDIPMVEEKVIGETQTSMVLSLPEGNYKFNAHIYKAGECKPYCSANNGTIDVSSGEASAVDLNFACEREICAQANGDIFFRSEVEEVDTFCSHHTFYVWEDAQQNNPLEGATVTVSGTFGDRTVQKTGVTDVLGRVQVDFAGEEAVLLDQDGTWNWSVTKSGCTEQNGTYDFIRPPESVITDGSQNDVAAWLNLPRDSGITEASPNATSLNGDAIQNVVLGTCTTASPMTVTADDPTSDGDNAFSTTSAPYEFVTQNNNNSWIDFNIDGDLSTASSLNFSWIANFSQWRYQCYSEWYVKFLDASGNVISESKWHSLNTYYYGWKGREPGHNMILNSNNDYSLVIDFTNERVQFTENGTTYEDYGKSDLPTSRQAIFNANDIATIRLGVRPWDGENNNDNWSWVPGIIGSFSDINLNVTN